MKLRTSLFATAVLLSSAFPAMAESTVHLSVGPVTYTLEDLAPDDGIAPSITFGNFTTPRFWASPSKILAGAWDGDIVGAISPYGGPLQAGVDASISRSSGNSTSHAQISDWRDPTTLRIGLDGHIDRRGDQASVMAELYSGAMVFELSPHTAVTFAVNVHASGHLDEVPYPLAWSGAYAYTYLAVHTTNDLWGPAHVSFDGYYNTKEDPVIDQSTRLSRGIWNNAGESLFGAVELNTAISINSQVPVPSVPEPATWATLAGGLGLLGLYRRRTRSGAAH